MEKSPLEETPLIQVAELLHASIPYVGTAMRAMEALGEEGYTKPNRGYDVILDTLISQADLKPAYLDVNIDELGGDTPGIMRRFMRLVNEHGKGVAPCVDSSNPAVLRAGLEEWFSLGGRTPLVNSVPCHEMAKFEPVMALRKQNPFSIVGMLVDDNGPMKTTDDMIAAAKTLYATFRNHGFQAKEIFFDAVTLGVTFDSCIDSMGEFKASHTHSSFKAIQRIMSDPEMKGVHAILGVSNWPHGVKKRRIGHIRAFVHVAMAHGLDAAIVDVKHLFGVKPADPDLIGLVEMFASLDGGEDAFMTYTETVAEAREKEWM
jgi:5-methyltetrahydrofolate--homocysteine methyltransferase